MTTKPIDYDELTKRLERTIKIAKKLGLQIVPCGGYAMDYSMDRLPSYPVGLFGALSIIEGPGARSRLGLTYLETSAIEEGFNSVQHPSNPIRLMKKTKRKKDANWLKLEAIGEALAKKVVQYTTRSSRPKKKMKSPSSRWTNTTNRFSRELEQRFGRIDMQAVAIDNPAPPSIADNGNMWAPAPASPIQVQLDGSSDLAPLPPPMPQQQNQPAAFTVHLPAITQPMVHSVLEVANPDTDDYDHDIDYDDEDDNQ